MNSSQTGTQPGERVINSGENLADLEGRLVKLADGGSVAEVMLPDTVTDIALLIVTSGGAEDENSKVISLLCEGNRKVRLNGTVSAGTRVVLCDPAASSGVNAGKVEALPATAGRYFSPGVAEEDGVDEQLLRIRPCPQLVHVATAFTGAAPAATAATNSTPYGFSQAQANALVANVNDLRTALIAHGLMATNA